MYIYAYSTSTEVRGGHHLATGALITDAHRCLHLLTDVRGCPLLLTDVRNASQTSSVLLCHWRPGCHHRATFVTLSSQTSGGAIISPHTSRDAIISQETAKFATIPSQWRLVTAVQCNNFFTVVRVDSSYYLAIDVCGVITPLPGNRNSIHVREPWQTAKGLSYRQYLHSETYLTLSYVLILFLLNSLLYITFIIFYHHHNWLLFFIILVLLYNFHFCYHHYH